MADFDLAIVGGGATAHAFLLGLPEQSRRKVVMISPMSDRTDRPVARSSTMASPKMNNPLLQQSAADWNAHFPAELSVTGDFAYMGFGNGGGTRFWGNSVGIFDDDDLRHVRLDPDRMHHAYAELGRRLQIWGNVEDAHAGIYKDLQPSRAPFRSGRIAPIDGVYRGGNLRVGTARNAVKYHGENACTGCSQCINGCPIGALWQSAAPKVAIGRTDTTLCDDWVSSILPLSEGYRLHLRSAEAISANQIVLAVDPLACFALLAPLAGDVPTAALAYNPAVAWLALSPRRQERDEIFGLAHSQAIYADAGSTFAFGHIFDGYPMTLSSTHVLSENKLIEAAFKLALPNALLGNMFFRSPASLPQLSFSKASIRIEAPTATRPQESDEVLCGIREMLLRHGIVMVASKFSQPGSDLHFAGGTPHQLQTATAHHTSLRGIFVAGGAAMESLPPQSPTFTFMAAAFDLARHWQ
ncbi:hypothetical protein [Devosia sp.]|uniref:hypothetical protein n=1 Tax=Devosia sp. TaxID=1871048 RepID=UPI003267DFC4